MAFTSFTGISDAARALQDYLIDHGTDIPQELRTKLRDLVGPTTSPVDAVVRGAELIYARADQNLPADLLSLAAGLALVAQQYNFHGMAEDDRGTRIALALMRDAGVPEAQGTTYPEPSADPTVKDEFKSAQADEPQSLSVKNGRETQAGE